MSDDDVILSESDYRQRLLAHMKLIADDLTMWARAEWGLPEDMHFEWGEPE